MNITAKDLTKEPPTSPSERVGGYAILARMDDKCRAMLAGELGEYHTDCPLDHMLLDFKGVPYAEIKKEIEGARLMRTSRNTWTRTAPRKAGRGEGLVGRNG